MQKLELAEAAGAGDGQNLRDNWVVSVVAGYLLNTVAPAVDSKIGQIRHC